MARPITVPLGGSQLRPGRSLPRPLVHSQRTVAEPRAHRPLSHDRRPNCWRRCYRTLVPSALHMCYAPLVFVIDPSDPDGGVVASRTPRIPDTSLADQLAGLAPLMVACPDPTGPPTPDPKLGCLAGSPHRWQTILNTSLKGPFLRRRHPSVCPRRAPSRCCLRDQNLGSTRLGLRFRSLLCLLDSAGGGPGTGAAVCASLPPSVVGVVLRIPLASIVEVLHRRVEFGATPSSVPSPNPRAA